MKITIRIQDMNNGSVRVVFEPSLEQMVRDRTRRKDPEMSPAEAYAFVMADAVKNASRNLDNYDPKRIIRPGEI